MRDLSGSKFCDEKDSYDYEYAYVDGTTKLPETLLKQLTR